MSGLKIDPEKCTGCAECLGSCPFDALEADWNGRILVKDSCTHCGLCVGLCKENAIAVQTAVELEKGMGYSGVCLFAEHFEGKLSPVVPELVTCARKLADDLNCAVSAIVLGKTATEIIRQLYTFGVDKVWYMEDERLDYFSEDLLVNGVAEIIGQRKPEILIGGATVLGRSMFPRLAARLSTGLTADCTSLEIEPETGLLMQTRPAFGGDLMATIRCAARKPQMATVRQNTFPAAPGTVSAKGEAKVEAEDFSHFGIGESVYEIADFKRESGSMVNIADADILFCGGRGLAGKHNFDKLEQIAESLNGAVGATRDAVDSGWVPYSRQVGQTGKTVNPSVYLAFGISGTIQHVVGMKSSKSIIAVNSDPKAPIFQISDFGIVGDASEIIDELLELINRQ